MNRAVRLIVSVFGWLTVWSLSHAAESPLPRSSPESQGVTSKAIREFVETANQKIDTLHSLMVVRHGHVVAEGWWKPEAADKPHVLHSLSKSFCSTAVGLAVAEGKLSIDDLVLKFFPDEAPEKPSDKLKQMRVRDLLTMSTGHETEPKFTTDDSWVRTFLAHPVPHKPGAHFQYNSPATYMQSAIVQKVTGQTVLDYLQPRLFEPLGIQNPTWMTSPQGISTGGWGLMICTEDIAKFGQLYLQKGKWNGKQLVPAAWIEQATAKQVSNGSDPSRDWDQGYGFQFWRCRHGAYRGDGAFGQFCIVLPEQDAVIAITADTRDMQAELNVVWDKLLPAFQAHALPANAEEERLLKTTLANLTVPENHTPNTLRLPGTQARHVKRDIPYADPAHERQVLDAYAPAGAKNLPVVFWIHGGGWQAGDKSGVQLKPQVFVEKGFVFVSTNYRLLPGVEMEMIIGDVAKSLGWVHRHIAEHGGDPNRLFVMGHSAGAQLAALMCIDDRYLKAEGVPFDVLKGCVPVDGDTYDVPAIIETAETRRRIHGQPQAKFGHREKFGHTPEKHRDLSAVTHVAAGKNIPPFLILHVADHPDNSAQAQRLGTVLKEAGIATTVFGAKETNHTRINAELGLPDDPSTKVLFEFVGQALKE